MTRQGRRVHLLLEGQTEEIVATDVIAPYLSKHDCWVTYSLVTTKHPAGGEAHRGGVSKWAKLDREIRLLLRDTSLDIVTTVFDYYGFPSDSPGMGSRPQGDPYARVEYVESALSAAIGDRRFLPNLVLHELEAWVFAAGDHLGTLRSDPGLSAKLRADTDQAGGPELVNDHPETAPSKRLLSYCADYLKTFDGPLAIESLGIDPLRAQCPHFDQWLTKLLSYDGRGR